VLTHIFSHLPPQTLTSIALVSHRFHALITTPHAWRIAFARYFPGTTISRAATTQDEEDSVYEKRYFTRLSALASWRSEYILRTRLLRALNRGRPGEALTTGSRSLNLITAQINYNSSIGTTISHIDASFGSNPNKRNLKFIHGAEQYGVATTSDPSNGRADSWGLGDPHSLFEFVDRFPGETQYGLGDGDVVGVPNSISVSRNFGMICGEGSPGGHVYYRSIEEQRGRILLGSKLLSAPEKGIPWLDPSQETICSVWISKTSNIPNLTEGLVGMMSGSSYGIVTAYSLGTNGLNGRRLERGEMTARWVLSPGVPIISISIDEQYSSKRHHDGRIWVVALNALGEVFYLTNFPHRNVPETGKLSDERIYELAWLTGQTLYWALAEPTRRVAHADPYATSSFDGSYSPRGSSNSMGLSQEQIYAETKEIEQFLRHKPIHFRTVCEGWDMRRRLEVDFAGSNENKAAESIFIFDCALEENQSPSLRRFTRLRQKESISPKDIRSQSPSGDPGRSNSSASIEYSSADSWSFKDIISRRDSAASSTSSLPGQFESWRISSYSFGGLKIPQISTTAIDMSIYATLTPSEDPLLYHSSSAESSPMASPLGKMPSPGNPSEIPGQRARLIAAGTMMGTILVWNMRAPIPTSSDIVNNIEPLRIIHTESPQISCLALTALYLVHGGNDGLVQAWDPLASNSQPIRTINSRFSSRARRRIAQAEASPWGVGINLFAAGAVYLDSDPTSLRGMVSIGTHLRYWSFSSQAADQYKSHKRRLRRSERGSNQAGERFTHTGRGVLQDYIANEKLELDREKKSRQKEQARLAGRFGLDLLGPEATEDEIMAYATMLSEEAAKEDDAKRKSSNASSETITDLLSSPVGSASQVSEAEDADLAAAIQASLEESDPAYSPSSARQSSGFTMRYARNRRSPSRSPTAGSSAQADADDLDFALQLSIAEERSRIEAENDDFPALPREGSPPYSGKGKGKSTD
jgi:hypothetical protein